MAISTADAFVLDVFCVRCMTKNESALLMRHTLEPGTLAFGYGCRLDVNRSEIVAVGADGISRGDKDLLISEIDAVGVDSVSRGDKNLLIIGAERAGMKGPYPRARLVTAPTLRCAAVDGKLATSMFGVTADTVVLNRDVGFKYSCFGGAR